jgi:hypothetical protein
MLIHYYYRLTLVYLYCCQLIYPLHIHYYWRQATINQSDGKYHVSHRHLATLLLLLHCIVLTLTITRLLLQTHAGILILLPTDLPTSHSLLLATSDNQSINQTANTNHVLTNLLYTYRIMVMYFHCCQLVALLVFQD